VLEPLLVQTSNLDFLDLFLVLSQSCTEADIYPSPFSCSFNTFVQAASWGPTWESVTAKSLSSMYVGV